MGDEENVVMVWDRIDNPQTAVGIAEATLLPDNMQVIRAESSPTLHN